MASTEVLHSPSTRAKFEQTFTAENKANEDDDCDRKPAPVHSYQLVSPRTITGPSNLMNKGAIDWYSMFYIALFDSTYPQLHSRYETYYF